MEQILSLFPKRHAEIKQLLKEHPDFKEMCEDYEEVSTLIATLTASNERQHETIAGYHNLLKDLEAEIVEALGSAAHQPRL